MRRWILYLSMFLGLCGLTLVGLSSWLLRSTDGAAWLLDTVAEVANIQITTGQLGGRLADDLVIEELVVAWPEGLLTARRIHLDWQPFSVLQQSLDIRALEIDQLIIRKTDVVGTLETSSIDENEASFAASDLAFLPGWLSIAITDLQLHGFSYQDEAGTAVIADELSGSYLWSQQQITASEFSYFSPYVYLRGSFDWHLSRPHLEMTADVHLPDTLVDPKLLQDIVVPVDFPGHISFDGDWNDFSGPVSFGTAAEIDNAVWLAADAQGSWQGIRFDDLQGRYLNGRLAGNLDLVWIDFYRMHGELIGTDLDPTVLIEDLDGRANLDFSGELLVPYDGQSLQASLDGTIHEAQLRGHSITGTLAADWQGGGLNELNLDLNSEEARVVARGKPSERLDLDLAVADLRQFQPDLAGQLLASGWLRWSDDYLTGEVSGSGEDIVWQESSLSSLNFQGSHLSQQSPLKLKLDVHGLRHADLHMEHLQAGVSGSLENHDLQLEVNGPAGDLDAQLTGHYRDQIWHSELKTLSAQTPTLGAWKLEAPAKIRWQPGELIVDNLSLTSQPGERVSIDVSHWGSTAEAKADIAWYDLSHNWLTYLQPSQKISGRSSGELHLEIAAQQPVSLDAWITASVELHDDLVDVAIPSLKAEAVWRQDGLSLNIEAESDAGELLMATASSSEPPNWQWPPDELSLNLRWQGLNLARLGQYREGLDVQGQSEGNAQLEIMDGLLLRASAKVSADGVMQQKSQPFGFRSLLAELNWDEKNFNGTAHVEGVHDGNLILLLTSTADPSLSWPGSGQIELKISHLDLQSLNPLLPEGFALKGVIRGNSSGYWLDDGQIILDGKVELAESELLLHKAGGQVAVMVPQAEVEWQWQGEHLNGSLLLLLAEAGELRGRWQLPLPARWPIAFVEDGLLQASLQGQLHATGVLAALSPGLVQDLQGRIESDMHVSGTWQTPVFSGRLSLLEGSAYLPATGVTLENFELRAALQGEQIKVEKLSLHSGPGTLTGSGELDLDRWRLQRYRLVIKGNRLQAYNFPELQILCNPEFTLTGDLESIQLHGSLLIPEMSLLGTTSTPEALPSNDVVIVEQDHEDRKTLTLDTDIRIAVELGDQVVVKTAGVETRLTGGGIITLDDQGQLATFGKINLVDGIYKAYGANLEIKQGLLNYTGGPITNPDLRIFAARDVGTVQAGVQITGKAEDPVVSLYSRPSMPERDILGYIFMGRPMRVGQEGEDALMIGAGALMPRYGETFSDLGISEIDIQGLFTGTGGVSLRKRLSETWEIESTLGVESGLDLYYIFKFD